MKLSMETSKRWRSWLLSVYKMLMYGRPRCAGEGEVNLMKYIAGWKIGRNGCPSVYGGIKGRTT